MSNGIKLNEPLLASYPRTRSMRMPENAAVFLVIVVDVIAIISASVPAALVYTAASGAPASIDAYFGLGAVAATLYVFIARSWGLYRVEVLLGFVARWSRVVVGWLLTILLVILFLFLLKIGAAISRGTMLLYCVTGGSLLVAARLVCGKFLRAAFERGTAVVRRAVVIGDQDQLAALSKADLAHHFGVSELGRATLSGPARNGAGLPEHDINSIAAAVNLARREMAEEVVLAVAWNDVARLDVIRECLRILPLPVRLLPDRNAGEILRQPIVMAGASLYVELQRSPLSVAEQMQKRVCDLVIATVALVAIAPLLAACALAIKIDSPGPVIFRQRRNGFNGRQFVIFKLRTMNVQEDGASIRQATRRDRRVTRVGRLLRRASIDELPQLFNVIRGEMSLVGPRPHALAHDDKYSEQIAEYAFRHHMKPGITGWAQVNGCRGETIRIEQMRERVACDLWYIDNWSVLLDFKILALTVTEITRGRMAY